MTRFDEKTIEIKISLKELAGLVYNVSDDYALLFEQELNKAAGEIGRNIQNSLTEEQIDLMKGFFNMLDGEDEDDAIDFFWEFAKGLVNK